MSPQPMNDSLSDISDSMDQLGRYGEQASQNIQSKAEPKGDVGVHADAVYSGGQEGQPSPDASIGPSPEPAFGGTTTPENPSDENESESDSSSENQGNNEDGSSGSDDTDGGEDGSEGGEGDQDQERDDTMDRVNQEFSHAQKGLQSITQAIRQIMYNEHGNEFQAVEDEVAEQLQREEKRKNGEQPPHDPRREQQQSAGSFFDGWGSGWGDDGQNGEDSQVRRETRIYKQFEHSTRRVNKKIEQIKQEIHNPDQEEGSKQRLNQHFNELNELIDGEFQASLQQLQHADFFDEETGEQIQEKMKDVGGDIDEAVNTIDQADDLDVSIADSDALQELQEKASKIAEKVSQMVENMVNKITGGGEAEQETQGSMMGN